MSTPLFCVVAGARASILLLLFSSPTFHPRPSDARGDLFSCYPRFQSFPRAGALFRFFRRFVFPIKLNFSSIVGELPGLSFDRAPSCLFLAANRDYYTLKFHSGRRMFVVVIYLYFIVCRIMSENERLTFESIANNRMYTRKLTARTLESGF